MNELMNEIEQYIERTVKRESEYNEHGVVWKVVRALDLSFFVVGFEFIDSDEKVRFLTEWSDNRELVILLNGQHMKSLKKFDYCYRVIKRMNYRIKDIIGVRVSHFWEWVKSQTCSCGNPAEWVGRKNGEVLRQECWENGVNDE